MKPHELQCLRINVSQSVGIVRSSCGHLVRAGEVDPGEPARDSELFLIQGGFPTSVLISRQGGKPIEGPDSARFR
jgi:hypothetical protein